MSQRYLMGLDIGGSGGRCLLVEIESGEVAVTSRPWAHRIAPNTGGWGFDVDLDRVWRALSEAVREAMMRASVNPNQVLGIAATSMRLGMVLLDADNQPLLAVPNRDARAAGEAMELARERGEAFYQRTGRWPSPVFAAARLLWLAQRAPADLKRARTMLSLSDWMAFRLTGTLSAERSHAGETSLLDLQTRDWAADLIASLDLPLAIFPTLVDAGTRLGSLTEEAAAHFGLPAGLPVAVGGADTQSGLLGVGAVRPEQLGVIAGTTTPVQLVTDRPVIDPDRRVWTGLHVVPGLWVLESNAGGMGNALDWFARLFYRDAPDPVATLIAEAATSRPGAYGMFSTLGASVFNASQMGLPVDGLTMTHELTSGRDERAHLARAIMEGLAYAVRANTDQLLKVTGASLSPVYLSGGMSRSAFWAQLISDVMNAPVHVSTTPEATALGAAICAGVGAGVYKDLAQGALALACAAPRHTPDSDKARVYHNLYADWNDVREARTDADLLLSNTLVEVLTNKAASESAAANVPSFRPRVLITADIDAAAVDALREMGDVEYVSYREVMRLLAGEDLVEALQGIQVFITEVDIVDAEVLGQLPDLRAVAVCRGNPVNVDINACTALGIPVIRTPGRNADAVADLTIAFLLMLARKLPEATTFLREPSGEAGDMGRMGMAHSQFQGHELWGKTIGLVGLGAVGRKMAQRLLPFGAQILVYDPYVTSEQAALSGTEKVSLDALLARSDFVSLHAPVTDETRGLIGTEAFARMKPGAFLINTARAALIDNTALLEALRSGHLAGAALDVFPVEPPGYDNPLLAFPNVIATPHIGGNTHEVATHQGQIIVEELGRLLRGENPHHVCNPEALENFNWTTPRAAPSDETVQQLVKGASPAVSDLEVDAKRPAPDQPAPLAEPEQKRVGLLTRLRSTLGAKEEPTAPSTLIASASAVRDHMRRILETFVYKVSADDGLREFSQGRDVTMHFILTDLDLDFNFSFQAGSVTSALGPPSGETDVTLKMSADTLDGIFTGRIGGTRAALSGKLSFKGDTAKAMAFQRIQKPMSQLYTAAREEVGDPGDLTQLGESAPAPQTRQQIASTPTRPQVGPERARTGDVRDDMLDVVDELYARGLITATGGNVSARMAGRENQLWITPSQIFKGKLGADLIVPIDLAGNTLDPNAPAPSSEWRLHAAIYRARTDVQAIIHTHALQTTILGMTGKPFLPISPEAAFIGEIPCVPFIMPGTKELANAVAEAIGQGVAVIMQNHGLVVAGSSLRRAADMTEIIEVTAQKILACYTLGQEPPVLPDEVVATLREIGKMLA